MHREVCAALVGELTENLELIGEFLSQGKSSIISANISKYRALLLTFGFQHRILATTTIPRQVIIYGSETDGVYQASYINKDGFQSGGLDVVSDYEITLYSSKDQWYTKLFGIR